MTLSHNRALTPSWARSLVSDPVCADASPVARRASAWGVLMASRGKNCRFENIPELAPFRLPRPRLDLLFGGPGDAA